MPVQAIEIQPQQPDTWQQISSGLTTFITSYWYFLVLPVMFLLGVGLA